MELRGQFGGRDDKGVYNPTEDPNTLQSNTFVSLLDLLSEGEVGGLVDGLRSVYFDNTPLQNADGTFNFSGVGVIERKGLPDQDVIPGFEDVLSTITVGTKLTVGIRGLFTITDSNVTAIRIRMRVPQLFMITDKGDQIRHSIPIKIELQTRTSSYTTIFERTIHGKTVAGYTEEYRFDLPKGQQPWTFRVSRTNAPSQSLKTRDDVFLDTYTTIIDEQLYYRNSALCSIHADIEHFGTSLPTRSYDLNGLLVQVPSNYDPTTRTYTGNWDGTFQTLWTNNPPWILYDLLNSNRYGLGEIIPQAFLSSLKWQLYTIAQYCDELVPNGFGEMEPRFTFNGVINSKRDAITALSAIISNFRAMLYWSSGGLFITQDSPRDPTRIVTKANVLNGEFNYEGSALASRHTVALVKWNDPALNYQLATEVVENHEGIVRYGYRTKEIVAIGCTSRGQAHRTGLWALFSENEETELVTYVAGFDHADVTPGEIIHIADADRAGIRLGGRIISRSGSTITLDQVYVPALENETIAIQTSQGQVIFDFVNGPTYESLELFGTSASLNDIPDSAIYLIRSGILPTTWRVLSGREIAKNQFEIGALEHNPSKYAHIEEGLDLREDITSVFPTGALSPPDNLEIAEALYVEYGRVKLRITLSLVPPQDPRVFAFLIEVISPSAVLTTFGPSPQLTYEIPDASVGIWHFYAYSIDFNNQRSAAFTRSPHRILGTDAPPQGLQGLTISPFGGQAYARWDEPTEIDVAMGGYIRFRHSPAMDGTAIWAHSTSIGQAAQASSLFAVLPLKGGTYLARVYDSSGIPSEEIATYILKQASINEFRNIRLIVEHPDFLGSKSKVTVTSENNLILTNPTTASNGTYTFAANPVDFGSPADTLITKTASTLDEVPNFDAIIDFDALTFTARKAPSSASSLDDVADFDAIVDFDALGDVVPTGDEIDVVRARLTSHVDAVSYLVGDLIDQRPDNVDDWEDWDGTIQGAADAQVWFQETDDDPYSISPRWSSWQRLDSAEAEARAFNFETRLSTTDPAYNIAISELSVNIEELA